MSLFLGEIFITVESTLGLGINDEGFTVNNFFTSLIFLHHYLDLPL